MGLSTRRTTVPYLRHFRAAGLLIVALAAACQDSATGPTARPDGALATYGQSSTFFCSTRALVPGGVREAKLPLSFPREALAADGSTMEYRHRRQNPSGTVTYSADCVIPRTMSALELMNQRVRVPTELRSPPGKDRDGNDFTTQGCVRDGECTLEPIIVTPPEDEFCERNIYGACQSEGGDNDYTPPPSDTGGGSGGGGSEDPVVTSDGCEILSCPNIAPDSAQRAGYLTAIERIKKGDARCASLYSAATQLHSSFKVWTNEYYRTDADGNSILVLGSYHESNGGWADFWTGAFSRSDFHITVAHEAAHHIGYSDVDDAADKHARSCVT